MTTPNGLSDEDRALIEQFRRAAGSKTAGLIEKETGGRLRKNTIQRYLKKPLHYEFRRGPTGATRQLMQAYIDGSIMEQPGPAEVVPRETKAARPSLTIEQKAALFDAIAGIVLVGVSSSGGARADDPIRLLAERLQAIREDAAQGRGDRARSEDRGERA